MLFARSIHVNLSKKQTISLGSVSHLGKLPPTASFCGGDDEALQIAMALESKPWSQERVPATFVTDSGLRTMPWIDCSAIRKGHQFGMDAVEQLTAACPGEVKPADTLAKKGVPNEYYPVSQETDTSRAMSWSMQHIKRKAAGLQNISIP